MIQNAPATPKTVMYNNAMVVVDIDHLSHIVYTKFRDAIEARASITQRLVKAAYAENLEYRPGACNDDEPDVYSGLTAAKSRTVSAWLKTVMLSAVKQLWTIDRTTQPEIPEAVNQLVFERLIQELTQAGATPEILTRMQEEFNALAKKHVEAVTDERVARIADIIEDMMDDADFPSALREFLEDLANKPYAVMAGPTLVMSTDIVHSAKAPGGVDVVTRPAVQLRRVEPKNFYWARNCTKPTNGEYVIEFCAVGTNELLDAVEQSLPGFIPHNVDKLLEYDRAYIHSMVPFDKELEQLVKNEPYTTIRSNGDLPCIKYHGLLKGSDLATAGVEVKNPKRRYECEVWTIDGLVVRVLQNVNPRANRNFYLTSMYKKPGAMVGLGLADVLDSTERMCNAALRSLAINMPFAAGAVGEVDKSRIDNADDADMKAVEPYRMYEVTADPMGSGAPAMTFHQLKSGASEFLSVYEAFSRDADAKSGIPAYIAGQLDIASMARTASGLSMLLRSASKVLEAVVINVDMDIFAPLIRSMYEWIMLYHSDPSIKADAKVVARGANGVLSRELGQAKLVDLLHLLQPYAATGMIPPEAIQTILREIVIGTGYDADKVIPEGQMSEIALRMTLLKAGKLPAAPPRFNPSAPDITSGAMTNPMAA